MNKIITELNQEFQSSCCKTQQYLSYHRMFKREFKKLLSPYCDEIEISKPNHFDISGFFRLKDNRIFYISISDLRWSKDSMLVRTAKDFKDYSGGSNRFVKLNDDFERNFKSEIGIN